MSAIIPPEIIDRTFALVQLLPAKDQGEMRQLYNNFLKQQTDSVQALFEKCLELSLPEATLYLYINFPVNLPVSYFKDIERDDSSVSVLVCDKNKAHCLKEFAYLRRYSRWDHKSRSYQFNSKYRDQVSPY